MQSIEALRRNRLRSGLTMVGVAWGMVTIILLLSYGQSLSKVVMHAFLGVGNNVEILFSGKTSLQAGGERAGRKINLQYDDVIAIRSAIPILRGVSAERDDLMLFNFGARAVNLQVKAVEYPYGALRALEILKGRYFEPSDFSEHRQVCIFGSLAAKKLFSGLPAVGQEVSIEGHSFDVIGILADRPQSTYLNGPDTENVFLPFEFIRELRSRRDPGSIVFAPITPEMHLQAKRAVRAVMASRHGFNSADTKATPIWDTVEEQEQIQQFGEGLTAILGLIGAMTLAVGGVGVMNIMLVSVTERTHEIGIMKATGARRRDILRQFLLESLLITSFAGLIGMLLSFAIGWLIPAMPFYSEQLRTANHEGDIFLHPSLLVVGISFSILSTIGVLSGTLPAMRAANLHPVAALRHDK